MVGPVEEAGIIWSSAFSKWTDLTSMPPSCWPQSPEEGTVSAPALPNSTWLWAPPDSDMPFLDPLKPSTTWRVHLRHQENPLCSHPLLWMFPSPLWTHDHTRTCTAYLDTLLSDSWLSLMLLGPAGWQWGTCALCYSQAVCPSSILKTQLPLRHMSPDTQAYYSYPLYPVIRRRLGFNPWVGKIPWRREWQPTPVLLPGEFPWKEEPLSMEFQSVRHSWAAFTSTSKMQWGFPGSSAAKESACNVGDLGSPPGLVRSPRGGYGHPLLAWRIPMDYSPYDLKDWATKHSTAEHIQ